MVVMGEWEGKTMTGETDLTEEPSQNTCVWGTMLIFTIADIH